MESETETQTEGSLRESNTLSPTKQKGQGENSLPLDETN